MTPVVWITGQPGSGKTTLAQALDADFVVDGDDLRQLRPAGFDEAGRRTNVDRAQAIAGFLHAKGFTVAVALVSPYRDQREAFYELVPTVEVYLTCSERRGREQFFAAGYEPPLNADLEFDTAWEGVGREVRAVRRKVAAATRRA